MDLAVHMIDRNAPWPDFDPAIHAFLRLISVAGQDVDARIKVRARGA